MSWRRSALYYLKRILRLSGTPYAIAMGTAIGVFVSFTPFVGLHIVISLALAWLFRANMIAGGISTAVGNPLTFPLIWASTYELGHLILGGVNSEAPRRLGHDLANRNFDQIVPLLGPMLLGSTVLGAIAGALAYLVVYKAVSAYQEARRKRVATRGGAGRMAESGQKP
ncbi:MAG: DUF2062 domain-containing protein [Propylenella sp.]